jgi:hypothetical protein
MVARRTERARSFCLPQTIQQPRKGWAMTKAQQTYERIEALIAGGTAKADAFKQLATEYEQSVDSVRGAYYTGRKQTTGETGPSTRSGRPRKKRETTEQDAIEWAVTALQNAIDTIENEVQIARERSKEARLEHEALTASAGPRIATIKSKIAALTDDQEAAD